MSGKGRIVEHLMADASLPDCTESIKGIFANVVCTSSDNNTNYCANPYIKDALGNIIDDRVGGSKETKCKCSKDKHLPKVTTVTRGRGPIYSYSCP